MARPFDSPDEEVRLPAGWFVGVDWGSQKHQVCVTDAAGEVLEEWAFEHGGAGLSAMADWLLSFAAGAAGDVGVAIETPRGPVVESLMEHGIAVHSINPKQLDRSAIVSRRRSRVTVREVNALRAQALVTDEFLFAIAPRDRIVAVSPLARDRRYSNVAELAVRMDLAFADSPEAIAVSRPDLMLVSHPARADYVELTRSIGIPVCHMLTAFENFDQIASALRVTGYLTDEDESAEREAAKLLARVRAARQRGRTAGEPARILAFSNFANTLGAGSLFDRVLTELGAVNVAAERGIGAQGTIANEHVAAWNPTRSLGIPAQTDH